MTDAYRLSYQAKAAISAIFDYSVVHFGEAQATKYLVGLRACFVRYATFPDLGPRVSRDSKIRQALYGKHRIFYRPANDGIEIGLILDQRQDFVPTLDRYLAGDR